jgi:hypothetical protein
MYLIVGHGVDLRHGGGGIGDCVEGAERVCVERASTGQVLSDCG